MLLKHIFSPSPSNYSSEKITHFLTCNFSDAFERKYIWISTPCMLSLLIRLGDFGTLPWHFPQHFSCSPYVSWIDAWSCNLIGGHVYVLKWVCQSQSHIATDGQSVSMSWCQAQIWDIWPEFYFKLLSCLFGAPSLTRGRVCHVSVFVIEVYHSLVYLQQYLHLN
jgi:hypothetical protein